MQAIFADGFAEIAHHREDSRVREQIAAHDGALPITRNIHSGKAFRTIYLLGVLIVAVQRDAALDEITVAIAADDRRAKTRELMHLPPNCQPQPALPGWVVAIAGEIGDPVKHLAGPLVGGD